MWNYLITLLRRLLRGHGADARRNMLAITKRWQSLASDANARLDLTLIRLDNLEVELGRMNKELHDANMNVAKCESERRDDRQLIGRLEERIRMLEKIIPLSHGEG